MRNDDAPCPTTTWMCKAILPVHTPAKHNLFRDLMKSNPAFNGQSSGPTWKLAVKVWNEFADTQSDIFYKVCFSVILVILFTELIITLAH
jgi:hypothetical protein